MADPVVPQPNEDGADGRWTERALLDRLRARHVKANYRPGNGPEWVYMEHVRSSTGWANRTIDALAVHLWQSRNHEVHAFEVKISRSDFRREVEDEMAKSWCWREWVEFFWIVAPDGVLTKDDMPDEFGLLLTRGAGLRVVKSAPRLRDRPSGYIPGAPIDRTLVASMLRSAARLADPDPAEAHLSAVSS